MLKVVKYSVMALSLCYLLPFSAWGQHLSARDSAFVAQLKDVLQLDSVQSGAVDSLYFTAAEEVQRIHEEIRAIERSSASEDHVQAQVGELHEARKAVRLSRDEAIKGLLKPEQRAVYAEQIKPRKPQVLHFGIHDRANCQVCTR